MLGRTNQLATEQVTGAGLLSSNNSKGSVHTQNSTTASTSNSRAVLSDDDSGCALEEYAWTPPGLSAKQVQKYFSGFPEHLIPYIDTPGDRYRCCQLLKQLPPQDNEARYCSSLSEDEQRELEDFARQRKEHALGRGSVKPIPTNTKHNACESCKQPINELAVFASRAGHNTMWHPQCFRCTCCDEMLVDLIYFYDNGKLYCGRHHAEKLKPRCSNCDEIIFCEECTEAESLFWHTHHFVCTTCGCALGGQRYIMRDQRPHCTKCFEADFGQKCFACEEVIALDQGTVSYQGQIWHAQPTCFSCKYCETPLLNRAFLPKFGMVFCSHDCSNRYEQTTSQILHQSVTPTGTQLQLAGVPDGHAGQSQQQHQHPAASRAYASTSSNIRQRIAELEQARGAGNTASPGGQPNPFKRERDSGASLGYKEASPVAFAHSESLQVRDTTTQSRGNSSSNMYKSVDTSQLPFRPIAPATTSSAPFPPPPAHLQQNSIDSQQQQQQPSAQIHVPAKLSLNANFAYKPAPPVPPKRTNSQLSNPQSIDSSSNANSNGLTVQPLGHVPSQTSLTNQSGVSQGTMNKSVNFNQNPVHSETSSIVETNSTNGGNTTLNTTATTAPKSILKKKKNDGTSQHHDFLKQFQRGSKHTQSLRRGKESAIQSEPECVLPFSQKSRRAKSIEQDLNKLWDGDSKRASGSSRKHNRSFSHKSSNSGYHSDNAFDSDSSSTLGDEDEEDDSGDWEHQAIALANSKIINPAGQHRIQSYGHSIDRRSRARTSSSNNTQAQQQAQAQPGSHTTFTSLPEASSAKQQVDLARQQKNLAQFNRDAKKLNKKLSKAAKKKDKHGRPCLQQ